MEQSIILSQLDPEGLRKLIQETLRTELQTLHPPKEEDSYKTRKETAEHLHVSLPTLDEYQKHGLIVGRRFGRRILFLESDIEKAVKEIPNLKYNRSVRR